MSKIFKHQWFRFMCDVEHFVHEHDIQREDIVNIFYDDNYGGYVIIYYETLYHTKELY